MNELSPDKWKQLDALLEAVLERDQAERESYLRDVCGSDTDLYSSVTTLLRLHQEAESILGESATDYAAPLIPGLVEEYEKFAVHAAGPDLTPGSRIGAYTITGVAGRGGMGTVYEAVRKYDTHTARVALKLVRRGMDTDDVLRRFRYEQRILGSLDHPDISRMIDAGRSDDGRPYFVMDFVEGLPIIDYCDRNDLDLRARIGLLLRVCRTVAYAHQKLVVHRDLKPSNILVAADGSVKLLDFGIAKLLEDDETVHTVPLTRPGARLLTPAYAAPEQIEGGQATTASDVYSLGVILYQLLTARMPFGKEGVQGMDQKGAGQPVVPSRRVLEPGSGSTASDESQPDSRIESRVAWSAKLRSDLDNIALKALESDPARRYPTPDQLADDLQRYLDGLPVQARPASTGYRMRKFIQRHKTGVAVASAFFLLLVIFTIGLAYLQAQTARERDIAETERDKAREVAAFLEDLLTSASPYHATTRADTLRLRDFVRGSTDRIRGELDTQPAVKAQMLNVLGNVHNKLGLYDEARQLLEESLDLRISLLGRIHPESASTLNDLGMVMYNQRHLDQAEVMLNEALAIRLEASGERSDAVAGSYTALANLFNEKAQFDLARDYYQRALDIRLELHGGEHRLSAVAMLNLATILQRQGELEAAEHLHWRALAINTKLLGETHPIVAGSKNNLGLVLADLNRRDEAAVLIREALDARIGNYGEEHPEVLVSLNNLATVLLDMEAFEEAETYFNRSLELRRKIHGENSTAVAVALNNQASLLRRIGRLDDAVVMNREAVRVAALAYGTGHPGYGIMSGNLALLLRLSGDAAGSERILRETIPLMESTLGPDHPSTARQFVLLGEALSEMGRFSEADTYLIRGYETLANRGADVSSARASLVRHYEAWNRPDEAEKFRDVQAPALTGGG